MGLRAPVRSAAAPPKRQSTRAALAAARAAHAAAMTPLLLLLALCGLWCGDAFRLATCTSSTGTDLAGVTCQFTPTSVKCPANWYCPLYETNQIDSYYPALIQASCVVGTAVAKVTGNSSYNVACPCTPGFYCPANTELPIFCPEGNYCPPSNASVVPFAPFPQVPSTGLGAFGSLVYQCPRGTWCPYGQVVPFECNKALSDCPPGSTQPNKTKSWVLLGFIVLVIFLCFQLSEYISKRERHLQDLSLEANSAEIAATVAETNRAREGGSGKQSAAAAAVPVPVPVPDRPSASASASASASGGLFESVRATFSAIRTPLLGADADAEAGAGLADGGGGDGGDSTAAYKLMDTTAHASAAALAAPPADTPSFHIAFDNIGLTLPSGVTVMSDVHGSFQPGRLCAIMGPSGAGKTTIINLVTGKARRSSGRVLVNGVEVDGLAQIAKLVGFVPQEVSFDCIPRSLCSSFSLPSCCGVLVSARSLVCVPTQLTPLLSLPPLSLAYPRT